METLKFSEKYSHYFDFVRRKDEKNTTAPGSGTKALRPPNCFFFSAENARRSSGNVQLDRHFGGFWLLWYWISMEVKMSVTLGLCGICPTPPLLWLKGCVKSDSDKHGVLPKAEYFSTLSAQKKKKKPNSAQHITEHIMALLRIVA